MAIVRPDSIVGDAMVGYLNAGLASSRLAAVDIRVTPAAPTTANRPRPPSPGTRVATASPWPWTPPRPRPSWTATAACRTGTRSSPPSSAASSRPSSTPPAVPRVRSPMPW
ncbi:hypothetical protein ACFQZC_16480 [Streptacidiphilus monticola]